ncbi:MAG: hypothetical protein H0X08_00275 [Blastocatellia bacterium]|nr:hypothetical protein [Blastocatellia bacterium]
MRARIPRFPYLLTLLGITSLTLLAPEILAHGGEDHGDQKPKTTANAKGIVSHSARLGDLEVMLKHPVLEPDQAAAGRLFITDFATNEPFKNGEAKIEIESVTGGVFSAVVQVSQQAGASEVKLPAMPEGSYIMRVSVIHSGETDTATFTGVDVKTAPATPAGEMSWFTKALVGFVFSLVLVMLGGLVYFVWRFAAGSRLNDDALSA